MDRKIRRIDYLIISHFDSDHCANAVKLIEKITVKNLIISKQSEKTKEFDTIIQLANRKNLNIIIVSAGDILTIEKDLIIQIIWPNQNLSDYSLNNNSIVMKLCYKNFSMLFTGDIESEAENQIIQENLMNLESIILKVAHHRVQIFFKRRIFRRC